MFTYHTFSAVEWKNVKYFYVSSSIWSRSVSCHTVHPYMGLSDIVCAFSFVMLFCVLFIYFFQNQRSLSIDNFLWFVNSFFNSRILSPEQCNVIISHRTLSIPIILARIKRQLNSRAFYIHMKYGKDVNSVHIDIKSWHQLQVGFGNERKWLIFQMVEKQTNGREIERERKT